MRFVFDTIEEYEKWIRDNIKPEKFSVYFTSDNEIIVYPLKTSKPISYGYFKASAVGIIERMLKSLKEQGFRVYRVKAADWTDDRPVGIKFTVEE